MITLNSLPRAILHVDCDAFFASVEQSLHPELKGRPVITGKERGIAASLSYEAKVRGVVRGMRLFEVQKVCPDCVLLPSDYETYSLVSQRFFGIVKRFTPDVEAFSIDEAFADLSGLRRIHRTSYEAIAFRIQETITRELGITVSMGLSLTKTLAKICSKRRKPAGFTCVKGRDLHHFLKEVKVEEVCGFGRSSTALLAKHGIRTAFQYADRSELFAKRLFGKVGVELWRELRGEAVSALDIELKEGQASLSKVKTFTPPSANREFVRAQLFRNFESAFIKLRRHRLRTPFVGALLTNHEYHRSVLGAELTRPTASTLEGASVVSKLFDRLFDDSQKYRQTGIYLSGLESDGEMQQDFFDDPCRIQSLKSLALCVDRANAVYGKHTLHLGSTALLATGDRDLSLEFKQHKGGRGHLPQRKLDLLKGESFRRRLKIPLWKIKLA